MGPTPKVSRGIDAEASSRPKRRAREGSMRPEGSGRRLVRGMRASLSRSRTMFSTLAAATTIAVPATVSRASEAGTRTGASQRPVAAVKTTDAVIRGLVSSRYALPAEMASRGRIGVPLREVRLVRLVKDTAGGEAAGLAAQAPGETFDADDEHECDHRLHRQINRPPHGCHTNSRNVVLRFVRMALQQLSQVRSPKSWTMAAECSSTSLVVTTPAIMIAASLPGSRSRAHANRHGAQKRASADGAAVERCRMSGWSAGPSDTDRAGLTLSGLTRVWPPAALSRSARESSTSDDLHRSPSRTSVGTAGTLLALSIEQTARFIHTKGSISRALVDDCKEIAKGSKLNGSVGQVLMLSAWFHDAAFAVNGGGREKSIEIARAFLARQGQPESLADAVAGCLKALDEDGPGGDLARDVLHDALLAPLASKRYLEEAELLRLEEERRTGKSWSDVDWTRSLIEQLEQSSYRTRWAQLEYENGRAKNLVRLNKLLRKQ